MGLDMYLNKKMYIGANYEHNNVTGKVKLEKDGEPINIKTNRISEIVERVGYWRKANQIHRWFVENVQDGKDNCGDYYVSEKRLQELLDLCKQVKEKCVLRDSIITNGSRLENGIWMPILEDGKQIENYEAAEELLPTRSGFFFGNTDYDEYYMQDIDDTIAIIEPLLQELKEIGGDVYYHSSW